MRGASERGNYRSYLLRLWQEPGEAGGAWRCSLEDSVSQSRRGFEQVEELASFLRAFYGQPPPAAERPSSPRSTEKT